MQCRNCPLGPACLQHRFNSVLQCVNCGRVQVSFDRFDILESLVEYHFICEKPHRLSKHFKNNAERLSVKDKDKLNSLVHAGFVNFCEHCMIVNRNLDGTTEELYFLTGFHAIDLDANSICGRSR